MKRVFIIGCPRSGSTWATFLLAQHPRIATFQHAKVFDYLHYLWKWYRRKTKVSFVLRPRDRSADPSNNGEPFDNVELQELFPEARFYELLRGFADGVLDSVASVGSDVEVVVDKTPENGHRAELVLETFPDAYFLHIVRDPRDTFCSHRSASRSWAEFEFPTRPYDGGRYWAQEVAASRRVAKLTDRYFELRYEDLKDQGPESLQRLLAWIGLEENLEFCQESVAACSKDRMRGHDALPNNFVRHAPKGGWRDELKGSEVRVLEHAAGELMQELGYERVSPVGTRRSPGIWCYEQMDRLLGLVDRRLHWLTQRVHWRFVGRRLEWPEP